MEMVEINSYGIAFSLGIFLGKLFYDYLIYLRFKASHKDFDYIYAYFMLMIMCFSKICNFVFFEPFKFFQMRSGFSSHGGFIGYLFGALFFNKVFSKNSMPVYINSHKNYIVFFSIPYSWILTGSIIRIGNFLNNELNAEIFNVLFPLQLVESCILFLIFTYLFLKLDISNDLDTFLVKNVANIAFVILIIRILFDPIKVYSYNQRATAISSVVLDILFIPLIHCVLKTCIKK